MYSAFCLATKLNCVFEPSATNFKVIFKPRSLTLGYNCSPDKRNKSFFVKENKLASEMKNRANKLRKKSFSAAEVDGQTVWKQVTRQSKVLTTFRLDFSFLALKPKWYSYL